MLRYRKLYRFRDFCIHGQRHCLYGPFHYSGSCGGQPCGAVCLRLQNADGGNVCAARRRLFPGRITAASASGGRYGAFDDFYRSGFCHVRRFHCGIRLHSVSGNCRLQPADCLCHHHAVLPDHLAWGKVYGEI